MSPPPTPCANGCPFYGTPQTNNLCSACFRLASTSSKAAAAVSNASSSSPSPSTTTITTSSPAPQTTTTTTTTPTTTTSTAVATSSTPPNSTAIHSNNMEVNTAQQKQETTPTPTPPTISTPSTQKPISKNRCHVCRKKLGLTPFVCRCAKSFCPLHRDPTAHACEFDFKAHHRGILARSNEAVIAKKLDKI